MSRGRRRSTRARAALVVVSSELIEGWCTGGDLSPRGTIEGRGPVGRRRLLGSFATCHLHAFAYKFRHARAVAAPKESADGRSAELARGRSQTTYGSPCHQAASRPLPASQLASREQPHPVENTKHGHVHAPQSRASRCTSTPTERARSHSRAPRERSGKARASVAGWLAGRSDQHAKVVSPPAEYVRRRTAPSPRARRDDRDTCIPTSDPHAMALRAVIESATVVRVRTAAAGGVLPLKHRPSPTLTRW